MLIKSLILLTFCSTLITAQTRQELELKHPGRKCIRDCTNSKPKICYFHWTLEHYHTMGPACGNCGNSSVTGSNADCYQEQCIPADGIPRGVMSINRKIPGPTIHVCQNDQIVVDVMNAMGGTSASIHWHGILQRETPWMDGVPFITQCPIDFSTTFRYSFKADDPGTQWYHSHSGHHKTDGHIGGIVVRKPKSKEINKNEYDLDDYEHLFIIHDWSDHGADMQMPGIRQKKMAILNDNLLINGKGVRRDENGKVMHQTPLEVFTVRPGARHRFRMINAMSHVCPVQLEIEKHEMRIIASDSFDLQPVPIGKLISNSGERYDFVIKTFTTTELNNMEPKPQKYYWIRVKGLGMCANVSMEQHAILSYNYEYKDPDAAFTNSSPPDHDANLNKFNDVKLNHPETECNVDLPYENRCITDFSSYDEGKGIVDVNHDHQFYLGFGNLLQNNSQFFKGNDYHHFMNVFDFVMIGAVNNISFQFPSTPIVSQLDQLSNIKFCDSTDTSSLPAHCRDKQYEICHCVHRIKVRLNSIVELIIVDEASKEGAVHHPFHLHGHRLFVTGVGQNKFFDQMTVEKAKEMVSRTRTKTKTRIGEIEAGRNYTIKDTISIPSKGWTQFRFKAENPGFWLLHCHFEWHLAIGMGLVLQVGEPDEMVPPPPNFPQCGNYLPPVSRV